MGQKDKQLFTALAAAVLELRMNDFKTQNLASTAWAFAKVDGAGQRDLQLFAAFVMAAKWCMRDFDLQELSMTLWAVS